MLVALSLTLTSEIVNAISYNPGNPETYPFGPTFPRKNVYIAWLSMDQPHTLPAFYSALLFFFGAVLCIVLASRGDAVWRRGCWIVASLFFASLSVDKLYLLHTKIPLEFKTLFEPYGLLGGLFAVGIGLMAWHFFPSPGRKWVGAGGVWYVGSWGMDRLGEAFAGRYSGHHMLAAFAGDAEGLLEMLGTIGVVYGLMLCLERGRSQTPISDVP